MSEGHSNFLNFFDVNRTPVNARTPQQPPNQSAPPPSDSNASGNAQPSERQINHVKNLLEDLNIEIGGFETHATQQGLRREEVWIRFEQDRMRIEAHQEPEHRLGDHWREIIENQAAVRNAENVLAKVYRQRWVLTSELAELEKQAQKVGVRSDDEASREAEQLDVVIL